MISLTHITRRKNLLDHRTVNDITLQEWATFVARDPEMRLDNCTVVKLANGEDYIYPNPGAAILLSREAGESSIKEIIFEYYDGSIIVKNANKQALEKIRLIAFKLNARIFRETEKSTYQIPVVRNQVQPLFRLADMFAPFTRVFYYLRHGLQLITDKFHKSADSNSAVKAPIASSKA